MQWEIFMESLKCGGIIPVIGNDLSLVKGNNGSYIPFYDFITREVIQEHNIPYNEQTIHQITLTHQETGIPNMPIIKIQSIYNKIKEEERFFTEPLGKLARITDFKFYISTSIDCLLEEVILRERNCADSELEIINYSLHKKPRKRVMPKITVYKLMGSLHDLTHSAIDEEKMLEYLFSISSREYYYHPQAKHFLDKTKDKSFLFIGCDFPDWLMRFVMRTLTNRRLSEQNFKDYVVNNSKFQFQKLKNFLAHCGKDFIVIDSSDTDNAVAFVDQLYGKWMDMKKEEKPMRYEGIVFLSYYHEDLGDAENFKNSLKDEGINVWFDKEAKPAGEHEKRISEIIRKCRLFVPLISNTILEDTKCYARDVEWKKAEKRSEYKKEIDSDHLFDIIPCITDKTRDDDSRIPDFMKKFTIYDLKAEENKIINEIKSKLKPIITE